jgi:hypothetical protein
VSGKNFENILKTTFIFCIAGYHNNVSYPNPQTPYIKEPREVTEALLFCLPFVISKIQP